MIGVYHLIKDGEVIYVGQSKDIDMRLYAHKDKNYDTVERFECECDELAMNEKAAIINLRPKYNIRLNPDCSSVGVNKKTINLPDKLHEAIKVAATKEHMTIEAFIAKALWEKLGMSINHG